jgi:hypothetical protein
MFTEEQIQMIEKKLNIKRQTNPDGTCVFIGCGRQAVNWLPNMAADVDGGRPELLNICKNHADLFGVK